MITLFKEITTEEALTEIEKESEKWDGLYCDLEVAEERKFVKEQATSIKDLLKKVNTARIAKTKDYRFTVEAEAKLIMNRLEAANKPFTNLLDKYQIKRNKILAAKKAQEEAEELTLEIERCHDEAFTLDKLMILEAKERKLEAERVAAHQAEREKQIAEQAAENARQLEVSKQANIKALAEGKKLKAEADQKNTTMIKTGIKRELMLKAGIDEETAIKVVKALLKIERITINYL